MKTPHRPLWLFAPFALALLSPLAHAQSVGVGPMFEVGGGMEMPFSHGSSVNVLLKIGGGIGLGGSPCEVLDVACMPRNSQLVIATIDATAVLDPRQEGAAMLPSLNIRFTPVSIPPSPQTTVETQERWARYGRDVGFHVDVLPSRFQRDVRVNREADIWVSAVGIDARLQAFPATFFGFFAQAAADLLGYRYLKQNEVAGGADGTLHGIQIGHARAEAGVIFLIGRSVQIRLSGGAEGSVAEGLPGGSFQALAGELEAFGQLTLSLTRVVELYARISTNHRWLNGEGFDDHRKINQFLSGLTVRFDR